MARSKIGETRREEILEAFTRCIVKQSSPNYEEFRYKDFRK